MCLTGSGGAGLRAGGGVSAGRDREMACTDLRAIHRCAHAAANACSGSRYEDDACARLMSASSEAPWGATWTSLPKTIHRTYTKSTPCAGFESDNMRRVLAGSIPALVEHVLGAGGLSAPIVTAQLLEAKQLVLGHRRTRHALHARKRRAQAFFCGENRIGFSGPYPPLL